MLQSRSDRLRPRSDAGRRPRRTTYAYGATGARPDRVAAWAVVLGVFLILVASATSQGWTGGASLEPAPTGSGGGEPAGDGRTDPGGPSGLDHRTTTSIRRLQARLGLSAADIATAAGRRALIARMPLERATWYGPGFYGHRTACGKVLRRSTVGVAHRRLPCGTEVTFYRGGRFRTVEVIDRGPYARGLSWDLTAAAAKSLGLAHTGRVRVIH